MENATNRKMQVALEEDLLRLSEKLLEVIARVDQCKREQDEKVKLPRISFLERIRGVFRLARHKQIDRLPKKILFSSAFQLFELSSVEPLRRAFQELAEAAKEAENLRSNLIEKAQSCTDLLVILRGLNVVWVVDQHLATANNKIAWDRKDGGDLNTISTRYMWKAVEAVEPTKVILRAAAQGLARLAKEPLYKVKTRERYQEQAIDGLLVGVKNLYEVRIINALGI